MNSLGIMFDEIINLMMPNEDFKKIIEMMTEIDPLKRIDFLTAKNKFSVLLTGEDFKDSISEEIKLARNCKEKKID